MKRKTVWIVAAVFLAICTAESVMALQKALKERDQREAVLPQE